MDSNLTITQANLFKVKTNNSKAPVNLSKLRKSKTALMKMRKQFNILKFKISSIGFKMVEPMFKGSKLAPSIKLTGHFLHQRILRKTKFSYKYPRSL